MNGTISGTYGEININPDVIAKYAGSVAVGCSGIVGMTSTNVKDGFYKLLKKDYLQHGIKVSFDDNGDIELEFHVIVSYGVKIRTVTDNLISDVKYQIEEFTGLKVCKINIFIDGVRVID